MRATKFEFEQRFWIMGSIFWLGFSLYWLDHTNVAAALVHLFAPSLDLDSSRGNVLQRLVFGAGALLIFLAASLRTWATAYLRTEIVHDASQHSDAMIADGPYRYVRNPLYLANVPMAAGIGVMASRLGWLFMVTAIWLFLYSLILREEDGLLNRQGQFYGSYLKAVPRFWPALSPRLRSGGARPHWGQAFAGESLIWLFGAAVLCFAVTLNFKLAAVVFVSSFAVYFTALHFLKKRAAT
ncbi:MAG: isoprenylcysteine carboxylmethyltransferase family protein [Bryobacteraceae bacterium]